MRKVIFPKGLQDAELVSRLMNPDRYGFHPRNPTTNVSIGRHVLGMTNSRFVSASESLFGSPRFGGQRYWIDVNKLRASGAVIHEAEEIARDLDRILAKTRDPVFRAYLEDIRTKSLGIDREVLIRGWVPAGAIKSSFSMGMTRGLQFVQGVGIVMSAYDLGKAGAQSYQQRSARPIAAEAVRQGGSWAAAWAGMKLGALTGGVVGIETGPGAIVTAAAGGLIGGIAGYFGADWIADKISPN